MYDTVGNLTSKTDPGGTVTMAYGNSAHVHTPSTVTVSGSSPETYGYDQNGNLTSTTSKSFEYTGDNRLRRVWNPSNVDLLKVVYDGDGQRVLKWEGGSWLLSLDKLYEKNLTTNTDVTLFVYAGDKLIATKKNGTVNTVHPDHLGGVALTMDSAGNSVVRTSLSFRLEPPDLDANRGPVVDAIVEGRVVISREVGVQEGGASRAEGLDQEKLALAGSKRAGF